MPYVIESRVFISRRKTFCIVMDDEGAQHFAAHDLNECLSWVYDQGQKCVTIRSPGIVTMITIDGSQVAPIDHPTLPGVM